MSGPFIVALTTVFVILAPYLLQQLIKYWRKDVSVDHTRNFFNGMVLSSVVLWVAVYSVGVMTGQDVDWIWAHGFSQYFLMCLWLALGVAYIEAPMTENSQKLTLWGTLANFGFAALARAAIFCILWNPLSGALTPEFAIITEVGTVIMFYGLSLAGMMLATGRILTAKIVAITMVPPGIILSVAWCLAIFHMNVLLFGGLLVAIIGVGIVEMLIGGGLFETQLLKRVNRWWKTESRGEDKQSTRESEERGRAYVVPFRKPTNDDAAEQPQKKKSA